MRTYSIEKRFGGPGGRMFSKYTGRERKKKFDFLEFLVSDETVAAPAIAEYLDTQRYPDGSYDFNAKSNTGKSAPNLRGTCYAVCALKSAGLEPSPEAIGYVERLKASDGSFRGGPYYHSGDADVDYTYCAVLALRLGGRSVPKESADYVRSLRNPDGSYGLSRQNSNSGPLMRTRQALTVLRAAGEGLSFLEREKTTSYILSRLGEDGFGTLENCYEAMMSLNLLGVELGPEWRETVEIRVADANPDSIEKKFKAAVIKKCIGLELPLAVDENSEDEKPHSTAEACYILWLKKLEKYGGVRH